jgi:hypothetical protein
MALTDVQCNKVKELSGHLLHLKTIVVEAKSKHNASRSSSMDKMSSSIVATRSKIINDREANRRYALIREYLISELTRSDELANQLRRTEEELVIMTDKCNGLEKKLVAAIKVATYSESSDTAVERRKHVKLKTDGTLRANDEPSGNEEPQQMIGKFVRKLFSGKPFFGLVVSFEHPYFSIVYEDADYEEVGRVDLMKVLWIGKVPGQKEHACMKHAKHLGMLNDDAPPSSYSSTSDLNALKAEGGLVKVDLSKGDSGSSHDNGHHGATISASSHNAVLNGPSSTQSNNDAVRNAVKPSCEPLSSNRAVGNYEEGEGRHTNFSSNQKSKGIISVASISGDVADHSRTGVDRKRSSAAVTTSSESGASQEKIVSFAQKCADAGLKYGSATQLQWKPQVSKEREVEVIEIIESFDHYPVRESVEVIDLLDSDEEQGDTSITPVKRAKTVD